MKTEKISIRISEEEKEKIAAIAKGRDVSVSQIIREFCREMLQKQN